MRRPHRSQHHWGGTGKSGAVSRLLLVFLSGLPLAATPTSAVRAQTAPPVSTEASAPFAALVAEASQRFGIPIAWIRALMRVESANEVRAVSPKGAMGVMQLMPAVAAELGVADPFAPAQSIDAGARHLKALLRRYNGDATLAIAAYNAGPGAVARYDGVPPFAETRAYLEKVEALRARYRVALSPPPLRPADALPVARTPTAPPANPGIATQVTPPTAPPMTTLPGGVLAAPAAP